MNSEPVLNRVVYAWGSGQSTFLRATNGKLYEAEAAVEQLQLPALNETGSLFSQRIEVDLSNRPELVVSTSTASTELAHRLGCAVWTTAKFLSEPSEATSVLWLSDCPDGSAGVLAEKRAREGGIEFAAVELRYPNLYIVPSNGWTYRDLNLRRIAVAARPEVFDKISVHPDLNNATPILESIIKRSFFKFHRTRACEITNYSIESSDKERSIVVPWNGNPQLHEDESIGDLDELVNEDHGVISRLRKIRHSPTVPPCLKTIQSDVSNTRRISQWTNNTVCQGSTFNDTEASRYAAIGESIERYCINLLDTLPITTATAADMIHQGKSVIDFRRLILFSEEQYSKPGFPFVPFAEDLALPWIPGVNLITGVETWVPMSMVYVNFKRMTQLTFPPIESVPYTGVAAGSTYEYAVMSSLEEIIERDATMIWWHSQPIIPSIKIDDSTVNKVVEFAESHDNEISFLSLPNEFRVPVVAAALRSTEEQITNVGFACRPTIKESALKALTEAYTLQGGSRDLLCERGQLRQAIERKEFLATAIHPYREDRRYLDDISDDFSDVDDLMMQQQINLDPRSAPYRDPWLYPNTTNDPLPPHQLEERSLDAYLKRITDRGYEPIVVDVTSPDVRMMGANVVKTIVPGLVPNFPAAYPHLGHGRIQNEYETLGILNHHQSPESLHYFPLPHA